MKIADVDSFLKKFNSKSKEKCEYESVICGGESGVREGWFKMWEK